MMKQQTNRPIQGSLIWILITFLILFLAASVPAYASGTGRIKLSVENPNLTVGQEVTVEVRVEDAPEVYGADIRLAFDPVMLEVVDTDNNVGGLQVASGEFINPAQSFILQHYADNEIGSIDYALTLLSPAPPVQGDGLLARITFRAKTEGQTTISISEGMFGTQSGETIIPILENTEISIVASVLENTGSSLAAPASADYPAPEKIVEQSNSTNVEPFTTINDIDSHPIVRDKNNGGSQVNPGLVVIGASVVMLVFGGIGAIVLLGSLFWLNRLQHR